MLQMIDFWAQWCGPCKMMEPVLEEIEQKFLGKLELKKINVDEHQDQAAQFGVMSIPTYVFMKDGQEIKRLIGYTPLKDMVNHIEKLLV